MITKNTQKPNAAYEVLKPLMTRFGARCSPEAFYWNVNQAYHAAESKCYDEIHRDMFEEEEMVAPRAAVVLSPAEPIVDPAVELLAVEEEGQMQEETTSIEFDDPDLIESSSQHAAVPPPVSTSRGRQYARLFATLRQG